MKNRRSLLPVIVFAVGFCSCTRPELETESPAGLFIQNATLIDGTGRPPETGIDILIRGPQIEAVGKELTPPREASLIDASGKFVLPGLIDTHIHLDAPMVFQLTQEEREQILEQNGRALLFNGVTTVLNLSSDEEWIWKRRAAQREGGVVSPRIFAMGRSFTPEGGWGSRHGGALKDAAVARKRALDYVAWGTDGFKVVIEDGLGSSDTYRVISDEMLDAIAQVAREHDVPIYVHAMNLDEYEKALALDPRAIVHGLEDPIPEGNPLIERLMEKNVAVVPTLSLWESFLRYDAGPRGLEDPVLRGSVPGFLLDRMAQADFMKEENRRFREVARIEVYDWAEEKIPIFNENVRRMHEAGVLIAVGTDAGGPVGYNFQGYNTPWELILLVEAGLSPMEAIVAATRNGADVIGVSDRLGTAEPGKLADLLILSGNPLTDIRNIRTLEQIVLDGKVFARQEFAAGRETTRPSAASLGGVR